MEQMEKKSFDLTDPENDTKGILIVSHYLRCVATLESKQNYNLNLQVINDNFPAQKFQKRSR